MKLVPTKVTQVSERDAIVALWHAWKEYYNASPALMTLSLCIAHMMFETGRFSMCRNYNVGNIKTGRNWTGLYCMYKAGEYINGKHELFYPPHPQTHFRAYLSLQEGMRDYLHFLATRKRYAKAWDELHNGDAEAYSRELRAAGYYTDTLEHYTRVLKLLHHEFLRKCREVLCEGDPYSDTELYD